MNVKIRVMHQNTLNGDMSMPVTDEAVEAAAEAFYMSGPQGSDLHWEDLPRQRRTYFNRRARMALEAAAPFIAAQALEDSAVAIANDGDPRDALTLEWLRNRATALRSA
jgi:hypothetical protein